MAKREQAAKTIQRGLGSKLKGLGAGLLASLLTASPALANPQSFMWGFASSSYQYEEPVQDSADPMGFRTDWDLYYASQGKSAPRANGIWGWSHFDKEIDALRQVGATHYRFSVEWARVEPKPGVYNQAAIDEYARHARALKAAGITPVVCLWHFTFPDWATDLEHSDRHGWLNPTLQTRWGAYVSKMVRAFGPSVSLYAPQNEVNNVARGGYLLGAFPPGRVLDIAGFNKSMDRAASLFRLAASLIRHENPTARLLSVQNMFAWDESLASSAYLQSFLFRYLDGIAPSLDYVGFNYYTQEPAGAMGLLQLALKAGHPGYSDLGWPIRPQGLNQVARVLYQRYKLPLIVTENGVADSRDCKRDHFLVEHLRSLKSLEAEGIPILGYFHWSLADNYEWGSGFSAQFGIFHSAPDGLSLQAKPSALFYQRIIRMGWSAITPDMRIPPETCG